MNNTQSAAELAELDALLADRQGEWWDGFYANRARPVPFFVAAPDECLAEWMTGGDDGLVPRGAALDIGCGNGRNAIFLARSGFTAVDAVDYSRAAVDWAGERAGQAGAAIHLHHASVFDLDLAPISYDLVYDSGCFHHMPPHRRDGYVRLVAAALKPGGFFGMSCFRPEGGSGLSDEEVYERKTLGGGLGYTEQALREIWGRGPLKIRQIRQMRQMKQQPAEPATDGGLFGESFLWALLAQKT